MLFVAFAMGPLENLPPASVAVAGFRREELREGEGVARIVALQIRTEDRHLYPALKWVPLSNSRERAWDS